MGRRPVIHENLSKLVLKHSGKIFSVSELEALYRQQYPLADALTYNNVHSHSDRTAVCTYCQKNPLLAFLGSNLFKVLPHTPFQAKTTKPKLPPRPQKQSFVNTHYSDYEIEQTFKLPSEQEIFEDLGIRDVSDDWE